MNQRILRFWVILALLMFGWMGNGGTTGVRIAHAASADLQAEEILSHMSVRQKIAQLICTAAPVSGAEAFQKKYQFGGYILFEKNISGRSKDSLKRQIKGWQNVSELGMLIAVDEEGGTVTRISRYRAFRSSPFLSPRRAWQAGGMKKVKADTKEKDALLKSVGINANFAPVVDVPYHSGNFIYSRAFSTNAKSVASYAKTVIKLANKDHVVSAMKHFPGYGGNSDTHTGVARDSRKKEVFENRDLLPFAAGIEAGCPMIMVSHNIVNCFDRKNPASLSRTIHSYLRHTMGFEGVIITDSMDMKGVTRMAGSGKEAAVRAILAGNDMICTKDGKTAFLGLKDAVRIGRISMKKLDSHVLRILKMKIKAGII